MLWKLPLYVGKQLDQFSDNQMRWRNRKVTDPGPVSLPWSSPWISVSLSVEWSLEALSPPPILPSEVLRFGVRPDNLFKKLYILSYLKNRETFHPVVHSSKPCINQAWPRLKPRAQSSIQVWLSEGQILESSTAASWGAHLQEAGVRGGTGT